VSLCGDFQATASRHPDAPALRRAGGGGERTWRQYANDVERLAGGLAGCGVRAGDTVALMLRNRPEFNLLDAAAMHLGAAPWSIYNTASPEQITDVVGRAQSNVLITEHDFIERASAGVAGLGVEYLLDVETIDEVLPPAPAGFDFDTVWRSVSDADLLTIIWTSGTTGRSKGVELTHGGMRALLSALTDVSGVARSGGRCMSYLPTAHSADRLVGLYWPMMLGAETTCVADGAQVLAALPEVRPTIWGSVPRVWEKLRTALMARGILDPATMSDQARALVLADLGLDAAAWVYCGAAPIPAQTLDFFLALGLPLCEVWGMSETGGLLTVNPIGGQRVGTVGPPMRDVELRIADDGEVFARGPNVMRGYRNDPERTAEAIDRDGWLHTGDIGRLDDQGYLTIVDRKKEIIINTAGKNMSPVAIENALKSAGPLIGQACVIGDARPYISALLVLDPEARLPADEAALNAAVDAEVRAANARLSHVEQVRRWTLLRDEWLPDGDELTPTMKLKRKPIAAKYASQIQALYEPHTERLGSA